MTPTEKDVGRKGATARVRMPSGAYLNFAPTDLQVVG